MLTACATRSGLGLSHIRPTIRPPLQPSRRAPCNGELHKRAARRTTPVRGAAMAPQFVPHTPLIAYCGWSAVALVGYVCYWLVLRRALPRGKPQTDLIDKKKNPHVFKLFLLVALVELSVVFLLPWAAAAASGAWAAAAQYFLPIAVMTAVNISLEGAMRRQGHVLAVYGSTGANNLWRLCAYFAALMDMHAAAAVAAAGVSAAAAPLRLLAWAGVGASCAIILIFEPAPLAMIPVQQQKQQ